MVGEKDEKKKQYLMTSENDMKFNFQCLIFTDIYRYSNIYSFIGRQPHPSMYIPPAAFMLCWQSLLVVTQTVWSSKPQIFTFWALTEVLASFCFRVI